VETLRVQGNIRATLCVLAPPSLKPHVTSVATASSFDACPVIDGDSIVVAFRIGVSFSPAIAEQLAKWVRKNRQVYAPVGFTPDELHGEEDCDLGAQDLCDHPKSWEILSISVLALHKEDLDRAGGLLPAFVADSGEINLALSLQSISIVLLDLFFRLRALGLCVVRPSDHSLFVPPTVTEHMTDMRKALGWKELSDLQTPLPKWTLKRPATFNTSLPTFEGYSPEYSFDITESTFFWSSRGLQECDYFRLDLAEAVRCVELHVFTGSRKHLFNWLRLGFLEVSPDGVRFKKVFVFLQVSSGVARVQFPRGLRVKSLRILVAEKQDAWLVIEDIAFVEE